MAKPNMVPRGRLMAIHQLYELPAEWRKDGWIHEPRPVQTRSRERIISHIPDAGLEGD